jgi:hypothetical protein
MSMRPLVSVFRSSFVRGCVVGVVATQALDWLSIVLYHGENRATRRAEDRARGHLHAYERALQRIVRRAGVELPRPELRRWGWRFHKIFGALGGVGYLLARRRDPRIGYGAGLAFGAAFFLVVDEVLVPGLGLTPGPRAFSWKVHARGAVSHLAYGVAAETVARLLDAPASSTVRIKTSALP